MSVSVKLECTLFDDFHKEVMEDIERKRKEAIVQTSQIGI